MAEPQFPNNSQRAKQPDIPPEVHDEIEAVISGQAITRRPSGFRRLRQSFIGGDSKSVGEHVFWNLMVPALKDTVADMGSTFIDMMIFGERRNRASGPIVPRQGPGATGGYRYSGITQAPPLALSPSQSADPNDRPSPNEVIVNTRAEAEAILTRMYEVLEKYNVVTVADMYRMIRKSPNYMDQKWGWTNLERADVKRIRGGAMLLLLPEPEDLH